MKGWWEITAICTTLKGYFLSKWLPTCIIKGHEGPSVPVDAGINGCNLIQLLLYHYQGALWYLKSITSKVFLAKLSHRGKTIEECLHFNIGSEGDATPQEGGYSKDGRVGQHNRVVAQPGEVDTNLLSKVAPRYKSKGERMETGSIKKRAKKSTREFGSFHWWHVRIPNILAVSWTGSRFEKTSPRTGLCWPLQ